MNKHDMIREIDLSNLAILYDGMFENGCILVKGKEKCELIDITSAAQFVQDVQKGRVGHCDLVELIGYIAKRYLEKTYEEV